MKKFGLQRDYIYLSLEDELNFSDVISVSQLIRNSNKKEEKLIEYYQILIGSLIKTLGFKHSAQDYIKRKYYDEDLTLVIRGLEVIREKQLDYIHCFSGDWVGNRWKMDDYETESAKLVRERVLKYRECREKFSLEIINIDKTIASLIGEEYGKVVLLSEIVEKYQLSDYFENIKDTYGEH